MGTLTAGPAILWLPILVSAVIVFVASSIIHMGPLWHRGDYPALPQEEEVQGALRPLALAPGDYFVPRAEDMKAYKTPEFVEKLRLGPVVLLTVMPNGPSAWAAISRSGSCSCWWSASRGGGDCGRAAAGTTYPRVFEIAAAVPSSPTRWRSPRCRSGTGAPGA